MERVYVTREPAVSADYFHNIRNWVVALYGPADPRVNLHGIYFTDRRAPCTSYPEPCTQYDVEILLPAHQKEPWMISRHLAHETVHCLHPNGPPGGQATVLEEGLAEFASYSFLRENFTYIQEDGTIVEWMEVFSGGDYYAALQAVLELISIERADNFLTDTKRMRAETSAPFAKIGATQLQSYFPHCPDDLADFLSLKFKDIPNG